ncbi:hypothetical protein PUN4_120115 [Paraburkholderia unamae]|nr:hypothetical protein PUN4_120115 [Paraburkholderia unamae]
MQGAQKWAVTAASRVTLAQGCGTAILLCASALTCKDTPRGRPRTMARPPNARGQHQCARPGLPET